MLRALRADAEAALDTEITRAVITVPAYFNQEQRKATTHAAQLAGLEVARIVNEPTAAALTYGFHDRDADQKLVVLDLGGGTFDVTVMEIFEGTLEILSTAGESQLGGEDFTNALVSRALEEMGRSLEEAEFRDPLLVARLREEAERAKRAIGASERGALRLPDKDGNVADGSTTLTVGAPEFAELVEPLMTRLRNPTLRALRDADLVPEAVDEVLLIGGATRMPILRLMASELFGRPPLDSIDPDQAVALGAAVQAALVADDRAVDDLVMTDVCPHTLGVEISKEFGNRRRAGYFTPVLHRNTTIPVSREETLYTVEDRQTAVCLRVFQGEARRVEDNLYLGELMVTGLPPEPAGLEFCVRFTYDLNALLEVEAYVPSTQKKFSIVLRQHASHLSDDEVKAAHSKMQSLKFYPREDLENQRLLAFAAAAVGEIDPFRREQLESLVDTFEHSLHANDKALFEHARKELLIALSSLGMPYRDSGEGSEGDG